MSRFKLNDRVNNLTILEKDVCKRKPNGALRYFFKCRCDCGNIVSVDVERLRQSKIDCGCGEHNRRSIVTTRYKKGDIYGKLTIIEKINKDHWLCKCDCGNETIKNVALCVHQNYGFSCGCDTVEKRNTTMLEKYGVENCSQVKEIHEKKMQTCLKNNGTNYPSQNKKIKLKMEMTNIERYGVKYVSQNSEIALKQARKLNKPSIKYHWKTNEELVCQGSYEAKTVDFLNENKIEYLWQSKTFTLAENKTYRPDLYLIDEDLWVEIKGYWRKDAFLKWEQFKKLQPNCEVWDKIVLKNKGILS